MAALNPLNIVPRMVDGLAIYDLGHGAGQEEPVLLMPGPDEFVEGQSARSTLALLLMRLGKRVLTFDPPQATALGTAGVVAHLVRCARQCLDHCLIDDPIDVVADGPANTVVLAFALVYPDRVNRLVMVGSPPEMLVKTIPILLYVDKADYEIVALAALLPNYRLEISAQSGRRPYDIDPIHFGAVLRDFLAPCYPAPFKAISVEL